MQQDDNKSCLENHVLVITDPSGAPSMLSLPASGRARFYARRIFMLVALEPRRLHRQVAEQIRALIETGELKPARGFHPSASSRTAFKPEDRLSVKR